MSKASPRITARVDADTQALLSQAAAFSGITSINAFVLNAAIEKANQIMEHERSLKLSQRDAMLLVNALDETDRANENLRQAAISYQDALQS